MLLGLRPRKQKKMSVQTLKVEVLGPTTKLESEGLFEVDLSSDEVVRIKNTEKIVIRVLETGILNTLRLSGPVNISVPLSNPSKKLSGDVIVFDARKIDLILPYFSSAFECEVKR